MMVLHMYRDHLVPGADVAYKTIEEDAARMCVEFGCPHPHLAMESLTGAKEVWWFNTFSSEAERQRAVDAYQNNHPLTAALATIAQRKDGLATGVDIVAIHDPDASVSAWSPGDARFVVGAITDHPIALEGAVFVAPSDKRIVLRTVGTPEDAESLARACPEARTFVVRPYWGMAAREWIITDPAFWRSNPNGTIGRAP